MEKALTDNSIMPWGRHKGKEMQDVPASYLFWLEAELLKQPERTAFIYSLLVYIADNRQALENELKNK